MKSSKPENPETTPSSKPDRYLNNEFSKATGTYRAVAWFIALAALVVLLTAGLEDNFGGFATLLPPFPTRLFAILLALLAYPLLRRLYPKLPDSEDKSLPLESRMKLLADRAFYSALISAGVTLIGLTVFFLFGNLLDFFLFLGASLFYYFDFYPKIAHWEIQYRPRKAEDTDNQLPPVPRRSLKVSLVLMGALALVSQGESRQYLYSSRQDCLSDWGDERDCQQPPRGSAHYGTHWWYGPRYGTAAGRVTRSVGVASVSRGGFGSLGSFHASFGG